MKLKTKQEIEELAHTYVLISLYDHRQTAYFSYKNGYTQAQQDLLASASEGFEEWKAHNLSCHESVRIHDLCERSYRAAVLSQEKELKKENEELKKIVSWCRYQLLPYSDYKPDYEKFHEMTKELFKEEAK